jgi:hypothetical protein
MDESEAQARISPARDEICGEPHGMEGPFGGCYFSI